MIRINLIAEGKRPVAARKPRAAVERWDLGQWLLLGLVLVGLLASLGHYLLLRNTLRQKEAEIDAANREVARLAPIIAEVERFKLSKAELERKIQVINNLKAAQRGPVRIMDEISRALPDLLWLTRMEVKETSITLTGEAFSTNAVASFIENLDKVPEFQEPVLKDTALRRRVYNFVITFNYSYASAAAGEAPQPGGG